MTSTWNDFNSADDQNSFDLTPRGTLVKVRMTIKSGGYDDPAQGWTGGYATQNQTTGSANVYRLVFGKPRQDDLVEYLIKHVLKEKLDEPAGRLKINLSP